MQPALERTLELSRQRLAMTHLVDDAKPAMPGGARLPRLAAPSVGGER
jgi:hypothetical protein